MASEVTIKVNAEVDSDAKWLLNLRKCIFTFFTYKPLFNYVIAYRASSRIQNIYKLNSQVPP